MYTNRRVLSDRTIWIYGLAAAAGGAYLLAWRLWLARYMGSHFVAWPAVGYALATAAAWFFLPAALVRLAGLRLPARGRAALHGLTGLMLARDGDPRDLHSCPTRPSSGLLSGSTRWRPPPAGLVRVLMFLQEDPWFYALWGGAYGLSARREAR